MMRPRTIALIVLLATAPIAIAQQLPGRERGFKTDHVYQLNGFDSIDLGTGNLNLAIPLGDSFPVSAALSYSFTLRYSGNIWHRFERSTPFNRDARPGEETPTCMTYGGVDICGDPWDWYLEDPDPDRVLYIPMRESAGLGWTLGFGELFPADTDYPIEGTISDLWMYKSPDGAEHYLYDTLHEGDPIAEDVRYSRDGTYLRLKKGLADTQYILEFPDGVKHLYTCDLVSTVETCTLRFFYDAFSDVKKDGPDTGIPTSNFVKFEYETGLWTITDSMDRTNKVHFNTSNPLHRVDSVELAAFGGETATYDLTYDTFDGGASVTDGNATYITHPCEALDVEQEYFVARVRLLTRVGLPSGEQYLLDYYRPGREVRCDDYAGTLTKAVLPTLGTVEWSYQPYKPDYTSMGVKDRIVTDSAGNKQQHTTHTTDWSAGYLKNIVDVLAPGTGGTWRTERRSVHYFQTGHDQNGGLPFTTSFSISRPTDSLYRSTETYDCRPNGSCGSSVRETYVRYEMDWVENCHIDLPCYRDRNRRRVAQRTLYSSDLARYIDTDHDLFDGLGHYRQTVTCSNFGSANCDDARTSYTGFNANTRDVVDGQACSGSSVGIYALKSDGTPWPGYSMLGSDDPWNLATYTSSFIREGAETARKQTLFDAKTGFLLKQRVLEGNLPGGNDVLSIFTPDGFGYVMREDHYGGDVHSIDTATPLCSISSPAPEDRTARIDHGYARITSGGSLGHWLATSEHHDSADQAMGFFSRNIVIDESTGLISVSRDVSGVPTTYQYDEMGRILKIEPAGTAWTKYDFANATSSSPMSVHVTTRPHGSDSTAPSLTDTYYYFDSLGRQVQRKVRMPAGDGDQWSTTNTTYDALGRAVRVTVPKFRESFVYEANFVPAEFTVTTYDVFDRPLSITGPDDKTRSIAYPGNGVREIKSTVEMALAGGDAQVTTEEKYDAHGRLIAVKEGDGTTTQYKYNPLGRLREVCQNTTDEGATCGQTRTFDYDNRGFLESETHRENGTVRYTYDARGHVLTKQIDADPASAANLAFTYDGAERLTKVWTRNPQTGAPVRGKEFEFGTVGDQSETNKKLGKLISSTRHNYGAVPGRIEVKETYDYEDPAGRLTKTTTEITHVTTTSGTESRSLVQKLEQGQTYDPSGNVDTVTYPKCTPSTTCGAAEWDVLTATYSNGFLTGVPGFADAILYSPAGAVSEVDHAGPMTDLYVPDQTGARPMSIQFNGGTSCPTLSASSITAPANICADGTGEASVPAYAGTIYTWSITGGTLVSPATGETVTFRAGSAGPVVLNVTATGGCGTASASKNISVLELPRADVLSDQIKGVNFVTIRAALSGIGPWTIEWSDGVTQTVSLSPALHNVQSTGPYTIIKVTGAGGCVGTVTGSVQVDEIPTPPDPGTPAAHSVYAYQKLSNVYSASQPARLWIVMDPPQSTPENPTEHNYTYEWFQDDGKGGLTQLSGTTSEVYVQTSSSSIFWAKITCTHGTEQYVTFSPHMYVYRYGTCDLPPLRIEQQPSPVVPPGSSVTFTAFCDWPGVEYQWYRGQAGDTSNPVSGNVDAPQQLTVSSHPPRPYWVRVTRSCGGYEDSPTLTFRTSECAPLLITGQPGSTDVAFGGNATLSVVADGTNPLSYYWYEGTGTTTHVGENSASLILQNVRKSGRYHANVVSSYCSNEAASDMATVRVASCPTIAPPAQWQTEVWTDVNTRATLAVSAGGATGYQWYQGEVGDESGLIPNGTSSLYVTEILAAESKYWVRISGANDCIVDSPTITVKLCQAPSLTSTPSYTTNIESGQWVAFSVSMNGTDLQYHWYEGLPGDTSTPVGMPVDKLVIRPLKTTNYWVKVTAGCGPNGSDTRVWQSEVFTASVCPVLEVPTATKSIVMSGTTTELSIVATGTDLTYQWYAGTSGDRTSPIAGGTTATITSPAITQSTSFWCEVKSGNCARQSETLTVSVCQLPPIAWSPQNDDTVTKGFFQYLRLIYVPSDEPVTYAWYQGPAGDTSSPISLQSAPGISPAQTTTYWVRVTMDNTGCYVDLAPFTVRVCIPQITTQPAPSSVLDKTSNPSAFLTLAVAADIPDVSYQWYVGQPGDIAAPIAGATNSSYDASPSADTTYWVRVTGDCGISVDSGAAAVTVCKPPTITQHPSGDVTTAGYTTQIGVTATGTELSYQWYKGAAGVTTTPVGGDLSELSVTQSVTTDYWVRVAGRCGTADSSVARMSVAPSITTQPAGGPITSGTTRTLSIAASGTYLSYQWYTRSGSTDTAIAGATAATYATPPNTSDTAYFCRVYSGAAYRDSDLATLTVCQPRAVSLSGWTGVSGAETTLSISGATAEETYEWYRGQTGDTSAPLGIGTTRKVYPLETTYYWARTKRAGCDADSAAAVVQVCYPKITTQPQGSVTSSGTQKTLTVAATGTAPLTYQWYIGPKGSTTSPVSGATGASYTTPALSATTTYWARVTAPAQTCGTHHADSEAATVTVCNPPAISSLTPTQSIQSGSSTTIKVIATGTNLTYQWYIGATGVTTNPVSGGTTSAITVSPGTTTTYWVQIKSEGYCVTNSGTVTVDVCTTPAITTQPQSQTIRIGQSASLSVATSATGATYQWYQGAPGITTTPLGTSASISVTPSADTQYWARVARGVCSANSAGATITVCALTASVANVNAASGQNATLTANVTNARAALTYTWYRGNAGDTSTWAGSGQQITVSRTTNTNYWVRVTDGTCTVDSNTATLNICIPAITGQPQSTMVTSGQPATLSVTATGSPLTYQWYTGDSGVTTSPISGATSASYTTPPLTTATKYWVRVTGCGVVNSATATVSVCIPPTAPTPTNSGAAVPGNNSSVSIAASGTGLTYQWYKGPSGDTTRPISGATSATYSFTAQVSEYYWVRVSGTCGTANSPATLHSVVPTITAQPQSTAVPYGSTATLSVAATGNLLTYQWYLNSVSSPIAGATSPTYVTPPVTGSAQYFVRVFSGSVYRLSSAANVTICTGPSVSFSASSLGNHSWNLRVNRLDPQEQETEYQFYIGTPGNVAQSTPQGGLTTIYYKTVTVSSTQTWWVRVWFLDHSCYTDTLGRTIY